MSSYALNQCALFKVQSKKRLAELLQIDLPDLVNLSKQKSQYKIFTLDEKSCEFTGKITKARQVEEPKGELRRVHDRIRDLLSRVALVEYAHAAVKGRSYRSNAVAHSKSDVVATFDIRKFYPSTGESHIVDFFFRDMQCSADVANLLGKILCFRAFEMSKGCLPTGSPASPIVSVYANKPMFDSLNRLAKSTSLVFTCYVDDLTFSGARLPPKFQRRVNSIVSNFGQQLHPGKTKIFQKESPKHITGVVIKDGQITVPNARMFKARKIQQRLAKTVNQVERIQLMRRLSGLLGEAANLDKSYKQRALSSYEMLAMASAKLARSQEIKDNSSLIFKNDTTQPESSSSSTPWA